MKLSPPKGMRDILVKEASLRSSVLQKIITSYKNAGFFEIITPAIEEEENISKSDGGDNLNLVFKILKRGEALEDALKNNKELSDMALRYDLTLPLSRFYAANNSVLPKVFKVIQTGLVYRAEKPQKGRLREFRQCDIDIIGEEGIDAEIELFVTSLDVLSSLGFDNLNLKLNDRRILYSLLDCFGFSEKDYKSVCITFDKLDKIGIEGVREELAEKQYNKKSIDKLVGFIASNPNIKDVEKLIPNSVYVNNINKVIDSLKTLLPKGFNVLYSPSLIRGQGYYTGMVGEVVSPFFSSAIAGGGRYDGMIGKFIGKSVPAVGFSIGFERIMSLLLESGVEDKSKFKKVALVYKESDDFVKVIQKKKEMMKDCDVSVFRDTKNKKHFFDNLLSLGFDEVVNFGSIEVKKLK